MLLRHASLVFCAQDAARLLLKADDDIRRVLSLDEAGGDGAPNDANEDDGDGPDADTTGEVRREDDGSVVSPNDDSLPPGGVWLLSSPAWTIVGDDRFVNGPVASDSNATLALDNRPSTHLEWSTEASTRPGSTPLWIAFDIGVCVAATGVRVYGSGTVGDVRMFKLSYSTNAITVSACVRALGRGCGVIQAGLQGPWTTALPSSQVGSDATGATRGWHEFAFPSSSTVSSAPAARFWRLDVEDNYGWQSGTVLVDVQLRGVAAQCTRTLPPPQSAPCGRCGSGVSHASFARVLLKYIHSRRSGSRRKCHVCAKAAHPGPVEPCCEQCGDAPTRVEWSAQHSYL